jgi:uncharacterized protein YjbI with pentapeptide repeats
MIEIKNRIGAVILTADTATNIRSAVIEAVRAGANLAAANLGGADLGGAYLGGADLGGADLGGADLGGAYLVGANLRYANLGGADLVGAYLGDADLGGANLVGANLRGADLGGANLGGADLGGADLGYADLVGADLGYANLGGADLVGAYLGGANLGDANLGDANLGDLMETLPALENIDAQIISAIEDAQADGATGLDMAHWHVCETTHCRAGWAIHLSGPAGYTLEEQCGPALAGALIYVRNGAERVPEFITTNKLALADLRERAAKNAPEAA